jgi:hypothetical protein
VDKYSRVYHPEIAGSSLRTRIKQKFRASAEPLDLWYPPKWGINEKIAASRKEVSDETFASISLRPRRRTRYPAPERRRMAKASWCLFSGSREKLERC